jgi:hypothetical protein
MTVIVRAHPARRDGELAMTVIVRAHPARRDG